MNDAEMSGIRLSLGLERPDCAKCKWGGGYLDRCDEPVHRLTRPYTTTCGPELHSYLPASAPDNLHVLVAIGDNLYVINAVEVIAWTKELRDELVAAIAASTGGYVSFRSTRMRRVHAESLLKHVLSLDLP